MMASSNDPTYQKIRSRYPGRFIKVAEMLVLEMQPVGSKYANNTHFDTDSGNPIGVDNICSGCISKIMDEFIRPLVEYNRAIKGFLGTSTGGVKIGTIRWEWLYNTGKRHKLLIPKSYYFPQGGELLLISQYW